MKIPHATLSPTALREVIEEFVTRDGTDHSGVQQRVADILLQLENEIVELHFDGETSSCNIVRVSLNSRLSLRDSFASFAERKATMTHYSGWPSAARLTKPCYFRCVPFKSGTKNNSWANLSAS